MQVLVAKTVSGNVAKVRDGVCKRGYLGSSEGGWRGPELTGSRCASNAVKKERKRVTGILRRGGIEKKAGENLPKWILGP